MTKTAEKSGHSKDGSAGALGAVLGVLALIAGVYAMVQPMNQRIEQLAAQIDKMEARMHLDDERERSDAREFAELGEHLKGNENLQNHRLQVLENLVINPKLHADK